MKKKDLYFKVGDDNMRGGNIKVEFYSDDCLNKYDIVKVSFKQLEGEIMPIYMTPDEALGLASLIETGIQFYLLRDKNYHKQITVPKEEDANKRKTNPK